MCRYCPKQADSGMGANRLRSTEESCEHHDYTGRERAIISTSVIVDPPSNFSTRGCTRPFRGIKRQKITLETDAKAAPQMMVNMSTILFLCGPGLQGLQLARFARFTPLGSVKRTASFHPTQRTAEKSDSEIGKLSTG